MARKSAGKAAAPLTTAQRLGSLVKSARDIMRKDKGLNGDLDRLPMLTWVMFLKFLDDIEQIHEQRAKLGGKKYRPAIEPPYRWRDWAADEKGLTGSDLIEFINQEEVRAQLVLGEVPAKGDQERRIAGLLGYLRRLQGTNGDDRRDVIASVFSGVTNRMESGYLLRDVINKVNGIHFNSSEEIHTLGHLYESMLKEMRDAAGDSGEFYTPRAVVRFMVEVTDAKLGDTVLDPACGTGGFLVEAFTHVEKQCRTIQDRQTLQTRSIHGGEAKSLPFMLAQMNLLLHGLESPQITKGNSLAQKITEIGDRDRVDLILTTGRLRQNGQSVMIVRTRFRRLLRGSKGREDRARLDPCRVESQVGSDRGPFRGTHRSAAPRGRLSPHQCGGHRRLRGDLRRR